jgi:hypothetical protein
VKFGSKASPHHREFVQKGLWNMQNKAHKSLLAVVGFKPIHAASFLCLLALTAQVLLPFVHFHQASEREHHNRLSISCTESGHLYSGGQALESGANAGHNHPQHDCSSCPICQYLFSVRNIIVQDTLIESVVFGPAELPAIVRESPSASSCNFAAFSPRSPPYA